MAHFTYSKKIYPQFSKFQLKEGPALYISHSIRQFGLSLVGIFLPIYILTLPNKTVFFHFDILNNDIIWILSYFLIRSLIGSIFILVSINFIFTKINFRKSFLISTIITIFQIYMWIQAKTNPVYIFFAAIASGMDLLLYWTPYHIFFVRKSKSQHGHLGQKVSINMLLTQLASSIGPLIGGLIIASLGFKILFIFSIILILVSSFPLLNISETEHSYHNTKEIVKKYLCNKKYNKFTISNISYSLEDIIYVIFWPIVLHFTLTSFIKIGSLTTLSLFLSSIIGISIGKYIDKHSDSRIHLSGTIINSILHISRLFNTNQLSVPIIDILDRINTPFYNIPFLSKMYEKMKGIHDSNLVIFREIIINISITIVLFILIIIIAFTYHWKFVFILASIFSLLVFLISKKIHHKRD